jgi:hypothetical protein
MAWVRIDDQFADHPKIKSVGAVGMAIQIASICYCNRYLTDGFISWSAADALIATTLAPVTGLVADPATTGDEENAARTPTPNVIYELGFTSGMSGIDANEWHWPSIMVNANLWELSEDGYIIHDYLEYNPTKEEVLSVRNQRKEAAKAAAKSTNEKRWGDRKESPTRRQSGDASGDDNGVAPNPTPNSFKEKNSPSPLFDFDQIVKDWNKLAADFPAIPKVQALSETRRQHVKQRFAKSGWDWPKVQDGIRSSPFLRGEGKTGWTVTFDFVFASANNWLKILEGNYNDQPHVNETPGRNRTGGGPQAIGEVLGGYAKFSGKQTLTNDEFQGLLPSDQRRYQSDGNVWRLK